MRRSKDVMKNFTELKNSIKSVAMEEFKNRLDYLDFILTEVGMDMPSELEKEFNIPSQFIYFRPLFIGCDEDYHETRIPFCLFRLEINAETDEDCKTLIDAILENPRLTSTEKELVSKIKIVSVEDVVNCRVVGYSGLDDEVIQRLQCAIEEKIRSMVERIHCIMQNKITESYSNSYLEKYLSENNFQFGFIYKEGD